jgi:hypothetical protein
MNKKAGLIKYLFWIGIGVALGAWLTWKFISAT